VLAKTVEERQNVDNVVFLSSAQLHQAREPEVGAHLVVLQVDGYLCVLFDFLDRLQQLLFSLHERERRLFVASWFAWSWNRAGRFLALKQDLNFFLVRIQQGLLVFLNPLQVLYLQVLPLLHCLFPKLLSLQNCGRHGELGIRLLLDQRRVRVVRVVNESREQLLGLSYRIVHL